MFALSGCSRSVTGEASAVSTPAVSTPAATTVRAAETTASAEPTTRAEPGPASVPAAFIGGWTGEVEQIGDPNSPYPVTVALNGGALGSVIATAEYPTLRCQVHWTLSSAAQLEITVRETVDRGNCVDVDVVLTLGEDGQISYSFDSPAHGRARLQRI